MSQCDHCLSDADKLVRGSEGEYCSTECHWAEEVDGPAAHHMYDPDECPGCPTEDGGDS